MNLCRMVCACVLVLLLPIQASADPVEEAERIYLSAQERWSADDGEGALKALAKASHLNPDARFMYMRILVLEKMGEFKLALQVLQEHRSDLIDHPEVTDVAVVEERLRFSAEQQVQDATDTEDSVALGPIFLGVGGVGLVGLAGYGLFGAACSVQSANDGCLLGTEVDGFSVAAYGGAGLVAITTALLWSWSMQGDAESDVTLNAGVWGLDIVVHGSF
jgi:hypothetical protein